VAHRLPLGAPGIYDGIPEAPIRALTGVRMDVAAFVGVAPRGPARAPIINEVFTVEKQAITPGPTTFATPVAVESWDEYLRLYSGFEGPGLLPYAVASLFEQGGRKAYIVRVVHRYDDARDGQGTAVGVVPGATVSDPSIPFTLRARNEGAWGDQITATLSFRASVLVWSGVVTDLGGHLVQLLVAPEAYVPQGTLLRLTLQRSDGSVGRELRFVTDSRLQPMESARGARRVLTLETAVSGTLLDVDLVVGSLSVDDGAGQTEVHEQLGLSSLHPRWMALALFTDSSLVYADYSWADGHDILPSSDRLATVVFAPDTGGSIVGAGGGFSALPGTTLGVGVDGGPAQIVNFGPGVVDAGSAAAAITAQLSPGASAAVVGGQIRITSATTGATSGIAILAANALAGFPSTGPGVAGAPGVSGYALGAGGGWPQLAGTALGVAVDGGASQTVTFDASVVDPASAAAEITKQLSGASASVVGGQLVITSASTGTGSTIAITAANPVAGFAATGSGVAGTGPTQFAGGLDRYEDIALDDFFDENWVPADEDPGIQGVHCLVQLADLSLLVVPDLYSPNPLAPIESILTPPSLAGATFAHCVQTKLALTQAGPAPGQLLGLSLDPQLPTDLATIIGQQQKLVTLAEQLRSFIVLLDVPPRLLQRQILRWRGQLSSMFAAAYHPWVTVARSDDGRGGLVQVNPSAFAAGVIARQEILFGVQNGPANATLVNAVTVAELVSGARHDELHQHAVNVYLRQVEGVVLTAARTLSADPSYRQLNVRRLVTMLERTLEQQCQWMVFEPNNGRLRHDLVAVVTALLRQLFLANAFAGGTEAQSFFVRCDNSINTQVTMDAGQLIAEVGVAPAEPLEFLVLRIVRDADSTLTVTS
jgi:hypothetical protein